MHNGTKHKKIALESIILGLKEKEYELVPISELIGLLLTRNLLIHFQNMIYKPVKQETNQFLQ